MSLFHAPGPPLGARRQRSGPLTQFDPNDIPDEDDDSETGDGNDLRKQLRVSQKNNRELQKQVDEAAVVRKENAFLKAGLPESPQVKFFQEHYQGDPTPEAIKTAAAEYGFVPTVDAETQAEVATIAEQSEALNGSAPSQAPDDRAAMMKEFAEVLAKGGNGEEVLRRWGQPVASDYR